MKQYCLRIDFKYQIKNYLNKADLNKCKLGLNYKDKHIN